MKKVYFLKTCDTCRRILKEVNLDGFEQQEIKSNPVTADQLDEMYSFTQSYEGLFNKRARKYKTMDKDGFTEADFRQLILNEYTFLKRPVFIVEDQIFVGNSKKEIERLKEMVGSSS
jgi:arsenate reductase